jgi:hypothetical protein
MTICKGNKLLKLYCDFILLFSVHPHILSMLGAIYPHIDCSVIHNIYKRNITFISVRKGRKRDESDSCFSNV